MFMCNNKITGYTYTERSGNANFVVIDGTGVVLTATSGAANDDRAPFTELTPLLSPVEQHFINTLMPIRIPDDISNAFSGIKIYKFR